MHHTKPIALFVLLASLLVFGCDAAIAAEDASRGKSVVVTWNEDRIQRRQGTFEYHGVNRQGRFEVYISSTGRIFRRISMVKSRASGSQDSVGDDSANHVTLSGHMITAISTSSGGARRIVINLDKGFERCTAQVIRGKAEGAPKIVARSVIRPGPPVEITSVKTSSESCSVVNGNVFGGK
jgi:hypothetical protein